VPNATNLRYALRTGTRDLALASRVIGVLYLAGAALVAFSVLLPHPREADVEGLVAIAGLAAVVGGASLIWAGRAPIGIVHAAVGAGTVLICLCIVFAGVATGIYSAMFIWVVLLAVSFFSGRAVALHVAWILVSWGVVLALVDEPTGFSSITRWALGSLVLVVTAVVMSEIEGGRRSIEQQLRGAQDELEHLAHHDPLTGVANRRLFEKALPRELARAQRHGAPLAVIVLDLDKFKEYNDENGHAAGDQLLQIAARGWTNVLRAEDLVARLGGDEFVALLPGCAPAEAERVAQRLCGALPRTCTCCTGIAHWDGQESADELLARADVALYEAKDRTRARATLDKSVKAAP
jgi:diguanylate cyclase (GGDEF)-like protein